MQIYDNSATDSTNFTEPMSGALTPQAGYYVGGLNTALQFVNPVNLDGDVAELAIYNGYLSDADRLAVLGYLEQKYFQTGDTNGVALQWQFDGTNIAGATNTTLLLADIQTNEAGAYSVIVSNIGGGSATSSNAVLTVGTSPSITVQPQSLEVVQGTNVALVVSVNGSGPARIPMVIERDDIGSSFTQFGIELPFQCSDHQRGNLHGYRKQSIWRGVQFECSPHSQSAARDRGSTTKSSRHRREQRDVFGFGGPRCQLGDLATLAQGRLPGWSPMHLGTCPYGKTNQVIPTTLRKPAPTISRYWLIRRGFSDSLPFDLTGFRMVSTGTISTAQATLACPTR